MVRANRAAEEKLLGKKIRKMRTGLVRKLGTRTQAEIRAEQKAQTEEHLKNMTHRALLARLKRNLIRQGEWNKRGIPQKVRAGGGVTNVRAHTRKDPRTGKVESVRAHTRKLSKSEVRTILEHGDLHNVRPVGFMNAGANGTYLLDLVDQKGTKMAGVFKPANEEDRRAAEAGFARMYDREVAAVEVGEALGLGDYLPAVIRRDVSSASMESKGGIGAMMEYINKGLENASHYDYRKVLHRYPDKELGKLAAFDYILGSNDRHANNWKTDGQNRIGLIDHGMTFPVYNTLSLRSNFGRMANIRKLSIKDSIGSSWDNKWNDIENILRSRGMERVSIENTKYRFNDLISTKDRNAMFRDLKIGFSDEFVMHGRV